MSLGARYRKLARHPRLPRRTVRLRLAFLYGGVFLLCGAGLLAITNTLVRRSPVGTLPKAAAVYISLEPPTGSSAGSPATSDGATPGAEGASGVAAHYAHSVVLHQLLIQSGVSLCIMAAVSVVLGWLLAGRVLRPVHIITAAVREISASSLDRRLSLDGPDDEFGPDPGWWTRVMRLSDLPRSGCSVASRTRRG
jgi:hypothetical protein